MNPLHEAASNGSIEDVILLLQQGEDLEASDEAGLPRFTPLKYAAKFGHLKVVSALLKHGADPNRALLGQHPPLFSAASRRASRAVTAAASGFSEGSGIFGRNGMFCNRRHLSVLSAKVTKKKSRLFTLTNFVKNATINCEERYKTNAAHPPAILKVRIPSRSFARRRRRRRQDYVSR